MAPALAIPFQFFKTSVFLAVGEVNRSIAPCRKITTKNSPCSRPNESPGPNHRLEFSVYFSRPDLAVSFPSENFSYLGYSLDVPSHKITRTTNSIKSPGPSRFYLPSERNGKLGNETARAIAEKNNRIIPNRSIALSRKVTRNKTHPKRITSSK